MHPWAFRARFRRTAFGWKGTRLAIERIHEALAEIRAVARHDPASAAEGAVLFRQLPRSRQAGRAGPRPSKHPPGLVAHRWAPGRAVRPGLAQARRRCSALSFVSTCRTRLGEMPAQRENTRCRRGGLRCTVAASSSSPDWRAACAQGGDGPRHGGVVAGVFVESGVVGQHQHSVAEAAGGGYPVLAQWGPMAPAQACTTASPAAPGTVLRSCPPPSACRPMAPP